MSPTWASGLQRAGALALIVLSVAFFVWRAQTGEDVPFLTGDGDARWITGSVPVDAGLRQWGRLDPPTHALGRSFQASAPTGPIVLRLRALGSWELEVNGVVPANGRGGGPAWREPARVDVSSQIREGRNEVVVRIHHKHGPPLLSLTSEGLSPPLATDSSWWWVPGNNTTRRGVIEADDTRVNSDSFAVETPAEALVAGRDAAIALFLAGVFGFLAARRYAGEGLRARLPAMALTATAIAWTILFARKFLEIPLDVGFDARHHLAYLPFLRDQGTVPLATDGWSTYHPPLFYAAAAWLESLFTGSEARRLALKAIPFAAGLGSVWVADALCRRLAPGDPLRRCFAIAFAAVLPAGLYSAAYFSNETLTTLLCGIALLLTVDLLLASRAGLARIAALSFVLGLALLTKYTAVIAAAVSGFFVIAKLVLVEGARFRRVASAAALLAGVPLLLAGWFYLRNLVLYGDPFMGNWGHMPGERLAWWQQPGFHTWEYYTRFGEGLSHPYLAGFVSVWDSLYTTWWGDGAIAGRVAPAQRHSYWSYEFMSAGYLLALPATALLLGGAALSLREALADPSSRRRAAHSCLLTFAYAVVFALVYMSLVLPYFAQPKAPYGLVVAPVAALFFAAGAARCDAWLISRPWARALFYGWLTLFSGTLFLGFAA